MIGLPSALKKSSLVRRLKVFKVKPGATLTTRQKPNLFSKRPKPVPFFNSILRARSLKPEVQVLFD